VAGKGGIHLIQMETETTPFSMFSFFTPLEQAPAEGASPLSGLAEQAVPSDAAVTVPAPSLWPSGLKQCSWLLPLSIY